MNIERFTLEEVSQLNKFLYTNSPFKLELDANGLYKLNCEQDSIVKSYSTVTKRKKLLHSIGRIYRRDTSRLFYDIQFGNGYTMPVIFFVIVELPLEYLPLFINDRIPIVCQISAYRLRVGK